MKVCVLCPTRNRVPRLLKMLDSFMETKDETVFTDMYILTDNDDQNQSTYNKMNVYNIQYPRQTITSHINNAYKYAEKNYDAFMVTNDDFVFKTRNWNRIMLDKCNQGLIAYPRDGNQDGVVPTTFMVPKIISKTLGWLQLPTLTHLYGDIVWQTIIKKCDIDGYCPNVLIEHEHYMYKKADKDEIYEKTNSKEMYSKDQAAFRLWLNKQAYNDCEQIRLALQ